MRARLGRDGLERAFAAIGAALERPTTLLVVGSVPGILSGQPERGTGDVDVWMAASRYDRADLGRAVRAAGLEFDPGEWDEPRGAYLQLVRPGVAALPRGARDEPLARYGNLELRAPDPASLVAMKLARGEPQDLDDIAYLTSAREVKRAAVAEAVKGLPGDLRETARENMVLLDVIQGQAARAPRAEAAPSAVAAAPAPAHMERERPRLH